MYLSIFYLLSFSLLVSFYFILSFKKVVTNPKSVLEACLYDSFSTLKTDSQIIYLDFEVSIHRKHIYIDILGMKDIDSFTEHLDKIYKIVKKKTSKSEVTISIIGSNKTQIFTKTYNNKKECCSTSF